MTVPGSLPFLATVAIAYLVCLLKRPDEDREILVDAEVGRTDGMAARSRRDHDFIEMAEFSAESSASGRGQGTSPRV